MNRESYSAIVWREFCKDRLALFALALTCILIMIAILAPLLAASPNAYNLNEILLPPSWKHLFGTDGNGRDVFSQLVWGARVSLSVGLVAVSLTIIIGVFLGALAGFFGGWLDAIISRLIEVVICFPTFFLILTLLAFVGPSIYNIMIAIGVTGWTSVARLMRGECLKLKNREFIIAAKATGVGNARIIMRYLLPNAIAPILVLVSFGISGAIVAESALSFLGFGVPATTPSWGSVLSEARQYMDIAWWLTLAPGFAIFITVTAYNYIGETLRNAIDPNLKG